MISLGYIARCIWLGTHDWDGIRAGINEDCARRYQDRKNELKRYFDAYGGYNDVENAKNHPPDTQIQEAWEKIIDELFLNVDFRKRYVKNASNRSKQLYATAGGSSSYAQMRHDDMRETEISSMLKDWKMMHTKKGGGWVNETTKDD
ncbi:hypothetical protein E3N88_19631 [Mikania micrantha]|uniref:Uncharacterized protein n=1 Tax=Mikania micrantha TaxID=192012 RepID=A0A5N6NR57_9ASTR|nr:hypothetical protein E3N88_19631 [Mikania micrantha]